METPFELGLTVTEFYEREPEPPEPEVVIRAGKTKVSVDSDSFYAERRDYRKGHIEVAVAGKSVEVTTSILTVQIEGHQVKLIAKKEDLEKLSIIKEEDKELEDIEEIEF